MKHLPVRTCIGCAAKRPKGTLCRIALDEDGHAVWDPKQVRPGRGAYICPAGECLGSALKKGRFNRAFRRAVSTRKIESSEVPWEK